MTTAKQNFEKDINAPSKQIIDGVDVSGCIHYKNRTCIADYCLTDMPFSEAKCELNPNCYYKEYKRKEQKLEKIKETINYYSGIYCSKCKHYKTCTSIDDCVNNIAKEVLQIIGGKENG